MMDLQRMKKQYEKRIINRAQIGRRNFFVLSGLFVLVVAITVTFVVAPWNNVAATTPIMPETPVLSLNETWLDDNFCIDWYMDYAPARGTRQNPLLIGSPCELAGLSYLVNIGVQSFEGIYIQITGDIDLSIHTWVPIGVDSDTMFMGTLSGGFNTIYLPTAILNHRGNAFGLFGELGATATIRNIQIDSHSTVGAFIGRFDGSRIGMVSGMNLHNATMSGLVNRANVSVGSAMHVGGIVGQANDIAMFNVANYGTVEVNFATNVGGIAGTVGNGGTFNAYNRGNIVAIAQNVGGIVGLTKGPHAFINVFNVGRLQHGQGQILGTGTDEFVSLTNVFGLINAPLIASQNHANRTLVGEITIFGEIIDWTTEDISQNMNFRTRNLSTQMPYGIYFMGTIQRSLMLNWETIGFGVPQFALQSS